MKFTVDQEKVLEDKSANLLVSASAGSGKTATIIEKIYRYILQGGSLDRLLVITFTESASSEMKIRLKERLKEEAKNNVQIRGQLDKLTSCDISTLHGFCSKSIRRNFFALDVKPNFVVLADTDAKFLKVKALEKTIRFYSKADDEEFDKLSQLFSSGRSYDGLKDAILSFGEFLKSVEDEDVFLKDVALSTYERDFDINPACRFLNDYVCKNCAFLTKKLREESIKAYESGAKTYGEILEKTCKDLSGVEPQNNFLTNRNIVKNLILTNLRQVKLTNEDKSYREEFKAVWEGIKGRIEDIKKFVVEEKDEEELKNDLDKTKMFLTKFLEITKRYLKEYSILKVRKNGLDFNDLEEKFLELLKDKKVLGSLNFEYIFVDEYQDINSVQEKILSILSAKSNMVMVGDIKQSIYGFRNSTPDIFVEKATNFENGQSGRLVNLNENFRSNSAVLEFVNKVFDKCMSKEFGGVDYEKNSDLKGRAEYKKCSNFPIVEVDLIDEKGKDEEQNFDKIYSVLNDKNDYKNAMTKDRKEAMIVAKKILELVGTKYFDAKEKCEKNIDFCDIAILCRDNEYIKKISKVLLEYKVPIETNLIDSMYSNKDVVLLISLLKTINNFHDDESLAVVLSSPFFNFSFDELWKIREELEDEEFFYESVRGYLSSGKDEKIKEKLVKFFEEIKNFSKKLNYLSLYEFLSEICEKYDYFDYLLSLPNGSSREKLVKDFVFSMKNKEYEFDLVGFLDFVKNYAKDNKFKSSFVGGNSAVKMGTIHSSKGLEYPIVFLVGCGNDFSNITFMSKILFDKDLGLGMETFDLLENKKSLNLARSCIALKKKREERAEEMRLLYVALTRAKNHLFVVASKNLEKIKYIENHEDARGVNDYISWILGGLSHIDFVGVTQNKKNITVKFESGEAVFNVFNDEDFVLDNKVKIIPKLDNFDKNKSEKLKKNLEYKFEKSQNIALKNSVSSLLLENSESLESFNFEPKKLTIFEPKMEKIDHAKVGTIYHKILEQIDFSKKYDDKELQEIINTNLDIEEKEAKLIDYRKIKKCVDDIQSLGKIFETKRELPFISYIPYNEIFGGENKSKIIVQGVADLLVCVNGKWTLIDYKTTNVKTSDQLVEKYYIQLKLYVLCLEEALNVRFENVFIYSFCLEKLVKIF